MNLPFHATPANGCMQGSKLKLNLQNTQKLPTVINTGLILRTSVEKDKKKKLQSEDEYWTPIKRIQSRVELKVTQVKGNGAMASTMRQRTKAEGAVIIVVAGNNVEVNILHNHSDFVRHRFSAKYTYIKISFHSHKEYVSPSNEENNEILKYYEEEKPLLIIF
uniref:Uncharacterized protein n=1 Tax=Glossina austeni TaxID=7395 RepID=A0A1A9VIP2_GLOAU